MKHNLKFGQTYEASPAMQFYLSKLKDKRLLAYGLSLFTSEFIFGKKHQEIIDDIYNRSIKKVDLSSNSMHKYGTSGILNNEEFEIIRSSLSSYIYEVFGIDVLAKCVLHSDFTVHYNFMRDGKIDEHVDDSDITINICLKNTTEKNPLRFTKVLDTLFSIKRDNPVLINFEKGDVLIHFGKQPHEVLGNQDSTFYNGERVNLVLWLKFKKII